MPRRAAPAGACPLLSTMPEKGGKSLNLKNTSGSKGRKKTADSARKSGPASSRRSASPAKASKKKAAADGLLTSVSEVAIEVDDEVQGAPTAANAQQSKASAPDIEEFVAAWVRERFANATDGFAVAAPDVAGSSAGEVAAAWVAARFKAAVDGLPE